MSLWEAAAKALLKDKADDVLDYVQFVREFKRARRKVRKAEPGETVMVPSFKAELGDEYWQFGPFPAERLR